MRGYDRGVRDDITLSSPPTFSRHPRLDRGSMSSALMDTRIRGYDKDMRAWQVRGYGSQDAGAAIGCVAKTLSMRRPSSLMT